MTAFTDWITHTGHGCPFPKGTEVITRSPDGTVRGPYPAGMLWFDVQSARPGDEQDAWRWTTPEPWQVVAYRIRQSPNAAALIRETQIEREDA